MTEVPPAWGKQGLSLLKHVTEEICTDPDCEIHHIEVGIEEETVSPADQAFWLSGYIAGWDEAVSRIRGELDELGYFEARHEGIAKLSR